MTEEREAGRLRSGGRLVIDALLAHGARRIFGVPGESFLPILDALFDSMRCSISAGGWSS